MTSLIVAAASSILTAVAIGAIFWFALGQDDGSY